MKKTIFIMFLAFLLLFSTSTLAGEKIKNTEFIGSVTYNTFKHLMDFGDGPQEINESLDGLKNGYGLIGGGRYNLNEQVDIELGLEGAFPSTKIEYEGQTFTYNDQILGPYSKVHYNINDIASLNGGLKYNFYKRNSTQEDNESITELKGNGLGFIIGGSINYPINENFSFNSGINYEKTDINIEKIWNNTEQKLVNADNMTYDLSGFRVSGGITYKF